MEAPTAKSTPMLRLLDALRAGKSLEDAAAAAGFPHAVAEKVAGSPLSQALRANHP